MVFARELRGQQLHDVHPGLATVADEFAYLRVVTFKYWTHALGVSADDLQKAVEKIGNSAAAVRKELGLIDDTGK